MLAGARQFNHTRDSNVGVDIVVKYYVCLNIDGLLSCFGLIRAIG